MSGAQGISGNWVAIITIIVSAAVNVFSVTYGMRAEAELEKIKMEGSHKLSIKGRCVIAFVNRILMLRGASQEQMPQSIASTMLVKTLNWKRPSGRGLSSCKKIIKPEFLSSLLLPLRKKINLGLCTAIH